MKIEIAESLFYSWLKHQKGCQIAQNNWKVSTLWGNYGKNTMDVFQLINEFNVYIKEKSDVFGSKGEFNICKKGTHDQFITQGECDALGVKFGYDDVNKCRTIEYYAVDVAFHSNGLGYGGSIENAFKVIEKCFRTAMCLYKYMGAMDGEIIFASPKITPASVKVIEPSIKLLQDFLDSKGFGFNIILLYGDSFRNEVLLPMIKLSVITDISDTNELFMRALELLKMMDVVDTNQTSKSKSSTAKAKKSTANNNSGTAKTGNSVSVGVIAKTQLRGIISRLSSKDTLVNDLQDPDYSKEHFGVTIPILVDINNNFNSGRYYSEPIVIGNKVFRLTNDWYERHRTKLEDWIKVHGE